MAAAGLAVWAVVILLPLAAVALSRQDRPTPVLAWLPDPLWVLSLRTFLMSAALAGAAVVVGWVPGRLLGGLERGRGVLLALLAACLLLPRYMTFYVWKLLLSPTSPLGRATSQDPGIARLADAATNWGVLLLWYWPLAAILLAEGWRSIDRDVWEAARLDAGDLPRTWHIALPVLARPALTAFGLCFVLLLSEFGTYHLSGIRTLGTEVAVIFDMTSSAAAVARVAWPVALPAMAVAWVLTRRGFQSAGDAVWAPPVPPGRWRWAVLAILLAWSVGGPLAILLARFDDPSRLRTFWPVHGVELAGSLPVSALAAGLALMVAAASLHWRRAGRRAWFGRLMAFTILLAMLLPGSLMGVGLLEVISSVHLPVDPRREAWLVSLGQAARFAALAMVVLHLACDLSAKALGELASVDGATRWQTWRHVHWPRLWPLPATAAVLVTFFGITELQTSLILLPPGVASIAQRLLNDMHYARDPAVVAACLLLMGGWALLATLLMAMAWLIRRRREGLLVALVVAALLLGGCEATPEGRRPEVVSLFGRTGSGPGEFLYPRAIARLDDGTLFVVDKAGRVQRFDASGQPLGEFVMPDIEAGKPTSLSVGPDGNLWIADTHYHRVMVATPGGEVVRQFGSFGEGDGQFIYPTDVVFTPDGRVLVSEYGGNDRVSIFDMQGRFLRAFGRQGSGDGEFLRPSAMAIDAARGRLYVADACNHRIAVYDLQGELLHYIGRPGRGLGELRFPYDIAVTGDGRLIVCEFGNNRLHEFSPDGRALATWGSPGREPGELAFPWGVVVDGRRAWVVDSGSNRVQAWRL